jgi:predicted 2-oxoglutarate/Fe(II)-dependent dioxygenase YbiX
MTELTERLKLEKNQADEEWKETGILEGKGDALAFSYEEFINLEKNKNIDDKYMEYLNNKVMAFLEDQNKKQFLEGWVEGILSVWEKVKSDLDLYIVKNFLDAELCQKLRDEMSSAIHTKAMVFAIDSNEGVVDEHYRKTKYAEVSDSTLSIVEARLLCFKPELERYFNLVLTDCETPHFLVYEENDFFKMHNDLTRSEKPLAQGIKPDNIMDRQVSVVIFLNNQMEEFLPESYCGGSLTFYGSIDKPLWNNSSFPLVGKAGLLVAFRSNVVHQVNTITQGKRYTIVSWFRNQVLSTPSLKTRGFLKSP